jgi:hypothetical protein
MAMSLAIRQSLARLEKTRRALKTLQGATTLADAESAWSDLLLSASSIYSKLEQGSKTNSVTKAWFGRIRHLRKSDPLLAYVHHARNSDEHGLEESVLEMPENSASISFNEPFDPEALDGVKIHVGKDQHGNLVITSSDPDIIPTQTFRTKGYLVTTVNDERFGDKFSPPTSHLGKKLEDRSPAALGSLLLVYLESLINEAQSVGV